ncbi:MAG: YIP1 family protein [Chloroflexota bacterium]
MSFVKIWLMGIVNPSRAFDELQKKPAPSWGFWAILVRFVPTSLTSILALLLLGQLPFEPSYLTFLSTEHYYKVEIFFLPVFGLAAWLLGSAVAHLCLRLSGKPSSFDWILNVTGFGLLIVMPAVWFLDWSTIALGVYGGSVTPFIHTLISLWEIVLIGIGLSKTEGLRFWPACFLGLIIKGGVYIPLAIIFVR